MSLIKPGYRNKYPPLGLMKISQYHGPIARVTLRFVNSEDPAAYATAWDRADQQAAVLLAAVERIEHQVMAQSAVTK